MIADHIRILGEWRRLLLSERPLTVDHRERLATILNHYEDCLVRMQDFERPNGTVELWGLSRRVADPIEPQ